jgi:hypothetical protein
MSEEMTNAICQDTLAAQGIDPGVVNTDYVCSTNSSTFFESINHFNVLTSDESFPEHPKHQTTHYTLNARRINNATFSLNQQKKKGELHETRKGIEAEGSR